MEVDTDYGVQVLIAVKRLNLKSPSVYICSEHFQELPILTKCDTYVQYKSLQKKFVKCLKVLDIFFVGQSCVYYEVPKSLIPLRFPSCHCLYPCDRMRPDILIYQITDQSAQSAQLTQKSGWAQWATVRVELTINS